MAAQPSPTLCAPNPRERRRAWLRDLQATELVGPVPCELSILIDLNLSGPLDADRVGTLRYCEFDQATSVDLRARSRCRPHNYGRCRTTRVNTAGQDPRVNVIIVAIIVWRTLSDHGFRRTGSLPPAGRSAGGTRSLGLITVIVGLIGTGVGGLIACHDSDVPEPAASLPTYTSVWSRVWLRVNKPLPPWDWKHHWYNHLGHVLLGILVAGMVVTGWAKWAGAPSLTCCLPIPVVPVTGGRLGMGVAVKTVRHLQAKAAASTVFGGTKECSDCLSKRLQAPVLDAPLVGGPLPSRMPWPECWPVTTRVFVAGLA